VKGRARKILPAGITPHCLRHSLNTNLLAARADPLKIQMYLGWTPKIPILTPVQRGYTHLTRHQLQDVSEKIAEIYG
jgi:site-specific recombinase XerD